MKMILWIVFTAFLVIVQPYSLQSQGASWQIDPEHSKVLVSGTSTLKDWTAQTSTIAGSLKMDPEGKILEVDLSFDSNTLDGGRGADMNNKIKKALKAEEYPQIRFYSNQVSATDPVKFDSLGKVIIAGIEKEISIKVQRDLNTFKAGKDLKLSDFSIEPPTAMFGQIVCHDDIELDFELRFKEVAQ